MWHLAGTQCDDVFFYWKYIIATPLLLVITHGWSRLLHSLWGISRGILTIHFNSWNPRLITFAALIMGHQPRDSDDTLQFMKPTADHVYCTHYGATSEGFWRYTSIHETHGWSRLLHSLWGISRGILTIHFNSWKAAIKWHDAVHISLL